MNLDISNLYKLRCECIAFNKHLKKREYAYSFTYKSILMMHTEGKKLIVRLTSRCIFSIVCENITIR
jgi:hypothetical protein